MNIIGLLMLTEKWLGEWDKVAMVKTTLGGG